MKKKIFFIIALILTMQFAPMFTASAAIGIPCGTRPIVDNGNLTVEQKRELAAYQATQKERIAEYIANHPGVSEADAEKKVEMCTFNDIFRLINNGIKFFLQTILLPFVIALIAYSGFLLLTSGGNEEKRSKAKKIFKNLFIGIGLMLGAWFIVYTIFIMLGVDTSGGRAGLSDKNLDWNPNTATAGSVILAQNSSGSSNNSGTTKNDEKYIATIDANTASPSSVRATVTLNIKAPIKTNVRMSCADSGLSKTVSGQGTINSGSNVTTIILKMEEDTSYSCYLETSDGLIKIKDANQFDEKTITTPRISAKDPDFKVVGSNIDTNGINITYMNGSSLGSDATFISCKDAASGSTILSDMGAMIDRSKTNSSNTLTILFPEGFLQGLDTNLNVDCTFRAYVLDSSNKLIQKTWPIKGVFVAQNNSQTLNTIFRVVEVNNRTKNANTASMAASVLVIFNGSINIDPNLDLVCTSTTANHRMRAKVAFDPYTASNIKGTMNQKFGDGSVNSPISIPVVWNGFGLRPNSAYSCELSGKTLEKVAGYPDQKVSGRTTTFSVNTPNIPLIKTPETKLSAAILFGNARVVYANYPLLNSTNPNSNGPYLSPSKFRQPIPDSMFVPVTNGDLIDNGRANVSCAAIAGAAFGTSWVKTVAVSANVSDANGVSRIYGDSAYGSNSGPGFAIGITKDPKSGFMHSSSYTCFASFTVEKIPQIRSFFVFVPFYFDATAMGPVVLTAEDITANSNYASFTVVASPRLQNSVNYSCKNVSGSYSGEVFWPPQDLGVRMPVAIPVSNSIPGLKPATKYNCELNGTTFQNQKVNFLFNIITP